MRAHGHILSMLNIGPLWLISSLSCLLAHVRDPDSAKVPPKKTVYLESEPDSYLTIVALLHAMTCFVRFVIGRCASSSQCRGRKAHNPADFVVQVARTPSPGSAVNVARNSSRAGWRSSMLSCFFYTRTMRITLLIPETAVVLTMRTCIALCWS